MAHDYKDSLDYQILIYPCVDLANKFDTYKEFSKDCYILVPDVIDFFVDNFIHDRSMLDSPELSPILKEDFSNLPKCLIIAAELDPLVEHSKLYHGKLTEHKSDSELKVINGTIHGYFHNGFYFKDAFDETVSHIVDFFEKL